MKMILRQLNLPFFLCLSLSLLCAGCAPKSPEPEFPDFPEAVYEKGDETVPAGYYIHTVSLPNESISIIAKWFTGDLRNWEELAKFNPNINPNRIFLGDKIKIPRNLMTRQDPMTQEFVEESQPKPRVRRRPAPSPPKPSKTKDKQEPPAPSKTAEEQPEEEEQFLFGPKDYSK